MLQICFARSFLLLVVGWSLCLLLANFHAYMPFVWNGLCWSCPHNLLWAAVLLSLWSVSACIIMEQWTMYPEVRGLLRIWQNNYIVISLKTDAYILLSSFPVTHSFTLPTSLSLTLSTNFLFGRFFVSEKLDFGVGEKSRMEKLQNRRSYRSWDLSAQKCKQHLMMNQWHIIVYGCDTVLILLLDLKNQRRESIRNIGNVGLQLMVIIIIN